jgi:hypothetical protein
VKVGDLITISAYGRSLKKHYIGRESDVGLIVHSPCFLWGTFQIQWASDGKLEKYISRRDIKYAKITT